MPDRPDLLREAVRRPLPLAYHPLYRFYEGGSLTRAFRGLPERRDDWWSEDWVGSCTRAGNDGPDGRPQGLSPVDVPGAGPVPLAELVEALPEEMVGARFAQAWGSVTGVLVKALGCDLGPHGIRVNAVEPGWVKTPMSAPLVDDPAVLKYYVDRIPLHRGAEPSELAGAIAYMLSDDASYVNSATLLVDAGFIVNAEL